MLDDLQRFLDFLIIKYGVFRVLLGPFATVSLLAGAGVITGGSISFIATGASLFIALVVISVLSLQLSASRHLLEERARIVNLYTKRFAESVEPSAFTIEDWHEEVVINKHGDATLDRWVTMKVGDESLYSIWSGLYSQYEVNDAERRRVKVEARAFHEPRILGARYDVTSTWEGSSVRVFIHFHQPASAGDIVRIRLHCEWPMYYRRLLDGDTDIVEWFMRRPNKRITAEMRFDKAYNRARRFSISPYKGCPMPEQEELADGSLKILARYDDIPVETIVGFKIDINAPQQ